MTPEEKPIWLETMTEVAANFNAKLTPPLINLWWRTMSNVTLEDFQRAMDYIVKNRVYTRTMPTLAEVGDAIRGGPAEDQAAVEAGKVWQAVCEVGPYEGVCFDDPVTQAVIIRHFGGWTDLCNSLTMDQQKWFIKDFVKAYAAFKRQKISHYGALAGCSDVQKVAYVGDIEKARQIEAAEDECNTNMIHKALKPVYDRKGIGDTPAQAHGLEITE